MRDRLFIDGEWRQAADGGLLAVVDPATEGVIQQVAAATAEDVDRAVTAARQAFEGSWSATSGAERAVYLRRIAAGIRERLDELARLEVHDNGKPLPEARWDIEDTAGCFDYYAGLAEGLDGRQGEAVELSMAGFRSRVYYEPVGVCAQIIPWNFPMLMASWKVAPALAAGCTSVLKPSEFSPLTALELAAIAEQVGLPRGVLNVLTGHGEVAGQALTHHPDVAKIAFTGSAATGRKVMTAAAEGIRNVGLELGGKSPLVIFADTPLDAAVEWTLFGAFWNKGEVCSATSRLLIQEEVAERFYQRLAMAIADIRIGSGFDDGVLLGPLVSELQYAKVQGYLEQARHEGLTRLCGGGRPAGLERGYFVEPTVFVDVPDHSRLWREEIFGPVLCTQTFCDEAEALAKANATEYGLAGAVMTADSARAERVARGLRAGIVWVNCSQPTFTEAPWGGFKRSGIGRELGRWGLDAYLEVKQVTEYHSPEPWGWYLK